MKLRLLVVLIALLSTLPSLSVAFFTQEDECPADVYYFDVTGEDVGQCTEAESPCKTLDYALEQGKEMCTDHVMVFYQNPNNPYQEVDWRPPPASIIFKDTLWQAGRLFGPVIGLFLGWLVAWVLTRRRKEGAAK